LEIPVIGSFVWYWVPSVLWQGLSVFAFITCKFIHSSSMNYSNSTFRDQAEQRRC
jgi:ligand-binding sensor domain-containing protein